jgi:hypothetical protein
MATGLADIVDYNSLAGNFGPMLKRALTKTEREILDTNALEDVIATLRTVQRPATSDERKAILGRLALMFPVQQMSEGQWRAFVKLYDDAIGTFSISLLEEFVSHWLSEQTRFPKPADFVAFMRPKNNPRAMALHRLLDLRKADERYREWNG